jgi:hypothetical protein
MQTCRESFTGTVMVPIEYPAYGLEPMRESDICLLPKGHAGPHEGNKLKLDEDSQLRREDASGTD